MSDDTAATSGTPLPPIPTYRRRVPESLIKLNRERAERVAEQRRIEARAAAAKRSKRLRDKRRAAQQQQQDPK